MKKETNKNKIARLPDKFRETIQAPIQETNDTNRRPKNVQPETQELSEYSGELNIRIPKTLHFQLFNRAKDEGVPVTEYVIFVLSQRM